MPETVAQQIRRTVSIVFTDLTGSTSLGERLDTESLREVLNVYFNEMRTVLERHGGTVEKYIGDAKTREQLSEVAVEGPPAGS